MSLTYPQVLPCLPLRVFPLAETDRFTWWDPLSSNNSIFQQFKLGLSWRRKGNNSASVSAAMVLSAVAGVEIGITI